MIDREKEIIKIAHEMVSNSILMYQGKEIVRCKDCELKEVCITSRGDEWYCGDARPKIEWGKVKGVPAEYEGDARSSWWYVCGECHGRIGDGDAYCKHCGCKIDWE